MVEWLRGHRSMCGGPKAMGMSLDARVMLPMILEDNGVLQLGLADHGGLGVDALHVDTSWWI